ncbi:MAG: hypothetical protein M3Q98_02855 [Actinomycetota bacterium]|nr:hypothetical protein [Actinomycetota bacterium]
MANLTIENLPDEVLEIIVERAKAQGESVNDFMLDLVNREFGTATMW